MEKLIQHRSKSLFWLTLVSKLIKVFCLTLVIQIAPAISVAQVSPTIMFDDFTYSSVDDPQLGSFNKWNIISGTSGPPEGAQYSKNNIKFIADPGNATNKLMNLSATVNGATKATTHSRIETNGFEYFEGTYSSRVYLSDVPFTYKDANIQTFYTIVSSGLSGDGSKYSELDIIEYMAADKWGTSTDNPVAYVTSWNRYIADPWQAWKRYFAYARSYAGWHTFTASCTDKVNVKYWIDDIYLGSQATTDNDGTSVYPRSNMQVAFANWIWNNVIGSSTANRTTTMQVDWTIFVKNQELTPAQVITQVNNFRTQGLQRKNLEGQTFITNPCTVVAQPGAINGSTTVSAGSSQTFSIASVTGATSYTWTLPAGWSGTSTSTSITTTVGSTGGTISVKANNVCSSSAASTLFVAIAGTTTNLATQKPTTTSTIEGPGMEGSKAVDGNISTRWASVEGSDPQWIYVDLGSNYDISRVKITWETAYGKDYLIQTSTNAYTWSTIKAVTGNITTSNDWTELAGTGRYIRIYGTARGTAWGYSIYELEVYGTPSSVTGFTTRIEAENYLYMAGVIKETCLEGGQNISSIDANDWMSYNINIPAAGIYKVSFRVASIYSGRTLRLEKDNGAILLATITVPQTGTVQSWATVSYNVTLPAGAYAIGVTTYTGGISLNWLEITNQLTTRSAITELETGESESIFYPNPVKDRLYFIHPLEANTDINILDLSGNVLMKRSLNRGENGIDLKELPQGSYSIRFFSKKAIKVERIYKE